MLSPGDTWRCLQTLAVVTSWRGGEWGLHYWDLVAETRGVLNIPQCTGRPPSPPVKNYPLRAVFAPWHVESSGSGIEPVFPALAGGFLTIGSPGKSLLIILYTHTHTHTYYTYTHTIFYLIAWNFLALFPVL